jgi:hypothetical protein
MLSRRDLAGSLVGFCTYALLSEVRAAVPVQSKLSSFRWIRSQDELARALKAGRISALEWSSGVNTLAKEVDVEELMATVRRAELRSAGAPFGHDPQKRFVRFRDEQGAPVSLQYGVAVFAFEADSVITPHAHRHMVSAHMVLEGKVRVRTFDRVRDEADALILRSTADEVAGPGATSTMTTPRDNVHWFTPRGRKAMTLDVIIDGLDEGSPRYEIQPVDPLGGQHLPDGTLRAPFLSFEDSMARYTARR